MSHYLQSLYFNPNTKTHNHATRTQHSKHVFTKNYVHFEIPMTVNTSL